jgi:tetratricopeptide (TPR) repeat protein
VRVDALRRARWERLLAEAAHGLSDFPTCQAHGLKAMEHLGVQLPRTQGQWVGFLLKHVLRQLLHLVVPHRWVRAPTEESRRLEAAALTGMRLGECYYWNYEVLPMAALGLMAVNFAERAGYGWSVLRLYGQLGVLAGMARVNPLARIYFRRAQGEGQLVEDPSASAYSLILESMYHLGFGRWAAAASKAGEALRVLLRIGDRGEHELAQVLLGHADYYTGCFGATLARYEEVRQSARGRGHLQHEAWGAYTKARSLIALGRMDEAMRLLLESRKLLSGKRDWLSEIICGGLLAQVHLSRGELPQARQHADAVMGLARQVPVMLFSEVHGYEGAAQAYLALWERESQWSPGWSPPVADEARKACARLSSLAARFPMGQPAALRCKGRMHWLSGRAWRARAAWRRSLRLARELGMPYDEALAHLELARGSTPGSPEWQEHLREALEGFNRLGCVGHVREVEALRGRSTAR